MDSVDLEVLRSSVRWQQEGHRVLLVTVVRTWGSSPRPEGAMLAVRDDGLVVGSVSGGCIEDDLIDRVRRLGITAEHPESVKYGISAEEAHRFGLPCGGTIELVTEPLKPASGIAELLDAVENGRLVTRTLDMATGKATLGPAEVTDGLVFDGNTLLTIHGPRYRMLVIGAGQLSKYLCQIAVGLGFQVTVCDPREEYTETWDIPGVTMVRTMPDDTVTDMKLDAAPAAVSISLSRSISSPPLPSSSSSSLAGFAIRSSGLAAASSRACANESEWWRSPPPAPLSLPLPLPPPPLLPPQPPPPPNKLAADLADPKSASLATSFPSASRKSSTLLLFKSRCQTPSLWMYSSAEAMCPTSDLAVAAETCPRRLKRSPSVASSSARNTSTESGVRTPSGERALGPAVEGRTKASMSRMMQGCPVSLRRMQTSRRVLRAASGEDRTSATRLRATCSPVVLSTARQTEEKEPEPRSLTRS